MQQPEKDHAPPQRPEPPRPDPNVEPKPKKAIEKRERPEKPQATENEPRLEPQRPESKKELPRIGTAPIAVEQSGDPTQGCSAVGS